MSKYVWDKVLDPASPPLTEYNKELDGNEHEIILEFFDNSLSDGWSIRYRQDNTSAENMFLCLNWAGHRLNDDLSAGDKFPREPPDETTDKSVAEMTRYLQKRYGLVKCDELNDPERVAIIWGDRGSHASTAHIQVLYDGKWESKLSTALWVITHGEHDFENFAGFELQITAAYKRKN